MEASKKKPIMIAVIVGCVVLAGAITYMNRSGGAGGLGGFESGDEVWLKCDNPDCGAEYQIAMKDYAKHVRENKPRDSRVVPPMVCKECGQENVSRAVKCAKCGQIFFYGSVERDFEDRCPECGYSKTEEESEKSRGT